VVTVNDGTQASLRNAGVISLFNGAQIQVGSGTALSATPTVTLQNSATTGSASNFGTGFNTIEVNANSRITIGGNAQVIAAGISQQSEAINVHGPGNQIVNYGYIIGGPSSAIFFENTNTTVADALNTVDNFGVIELRTGSSPNPVTGGQAVGSAGAVGINFINESGAQVIGNLDLQGGNDNVTLNPDSKIIGNLNGGGGTNTLTLNASPTSGDTLNGQVNNFQVLNKRGGGMWTVSGSVGNTGTVPLSVYVRQGTLFLEGDNTNFNGSVIVNPEDVANPDPSVVGPDSSATLEARAQSLPPLVTDHGQVLFNQFTPDGSTDSPNGTYSGVIRGEGSVGKTGPGTTILTSNNTYTGTTTVFQGALAVGEAPGSAGELSGGGAVSVLSGATLGGYGVIAGNVNNAGTIAVGNATPALESGSAGSFTFLGDLNNSGTVNLVSDTIGDALIVKGNYQGAPGATVQLSTVLNEGGALTNQFTDRLLISGNATNTTQLLVKASGNGAPTPTGHADTASTGISVVQVAGMSTPQAFVLGNGGVLGNDPFIYHLNAYGPGSTLGPSDPAQADSRGGGNTWDFRLQNTYVEPDGGRVEPDGEIEEPDGEIVEPGEGELEEARPEVAPQVAAYLTAPLAMFEAGYLDIATLHQRLGEIRYDDGSASGGDNADLSKEVFARAYGGQFNYTSNVAFKDFGYNTSIDAAAVQFGGTILRQQGSDGVWRYCLAASFGHVWWSPSAVDGNSNGNVNRYTFYGTATYQANAGWYADGIVFGGLFDGYVSTDTASHESNMDGTTAGLSLESGYPFRLTASGLSLEPQVQVVWQHLSFDTKTDVNGIVNDLGGQDSALLRLGFRLAQPLQLQGKYPLTPYFKFNFLQPLTAGGRAVIGQSPFEVGRNGSSMQVGAGITGKLNSRLSIYGDALYQRRLVSYGSNGWLANAGLRYSF
jgi:outer membrane autotransporter protein